VLRFTNFVGPRIDSVLSRYFALPVVPTVLGFDPRLQFLHEDDALEILRLATLEDRAGTFNAGGTGVLLLSQAIRRAGRIALPIPEPLVTTVGQAFRRAGLADFSPEQMRFLEHGRVADTRRLREEFGYTPKYTSLEAFDDYVRGRDLNRLIAPERVMEIERRTLDMLVGRRGAHA
ncbi:MAG: hypothetical protein ABR520_09270, partial [Mycobacteriales bacterium]